MHTFGALCHTLVRVPLFSSVLQDASPVFSTREHSLGRGRTHQAECSEACKICFSSSLNAAESQRPSRQP